MTRLVASAEADPASQAARGELSRQRAALYDWNELTSREKSLTAGSFFSFNTFKFLISRIGFPGFEGPFGTLKSTGRPTILEASSFLVVEATSTTSISFPRRISTTKQSPGFQINHMLGFVRHMRAVIV